MHKLESGVSQVGAGSCGFSRKKLMKHKHSYQRALTSGTSLQVQLLNNFVFSALVVNSQSCHWNRVRNYMEGCHGCGRPYDDSFADWTICRSCMMSQAQESGMEVAYMDSLGIMWTQQDLEEAGGLQEVIRMNKEARI